MDRIPVIYLLGISYSGSTLLGYLLGAVPEVFNAGELKQFNRVGELRDRECTCGRRVANCPLWKDIDFETPRIYNKPGLVEKLTGAVRILRSGGGKGEDRPWGPETDDAAFFRTVHSRVCESSANPCYILDASKSIYRLLHLLQYEDLDIRVIFMEREIHGNVASFVKYKQGFVTGLVTYKANQLLSHRLLQRSKFPHLYVSHSNLCERPQEEFRRIGEFLDLDYSEVFDRLPDRTYHVFTGNIHTHKQFKGGFGGLRRDHSWRERLSPLQKRVIDWVE